MRSKSYYAKFALVKISNVVMFAFTCALIYVCTATYVFMYVLIYIHMYVRTMHTLHTCVLMQGLGRPAHST